MVEDARPPRADAVRNRERVLAAAFEVFSEAGTSASMTDIAARAGVGPGTIYRHFPTKEDLFRAVVTDRFQAVGVYGHDLLASTSPETALFEFLRTMVTDASRSKALADAIVGSDYDITDSEAPFIATLADLLTAAQSAGTVRTDVTPVDIKALLSACYVVHSQGDQYLPAVMNVVFDGLRAR